MEKNMFTLLSKKFIYLTFSVAMGAILITPNLQAADVAKSYSYNSYENYDSYENYKNLQPKNYDLPFYYNIYYSSPISFKPYFLGSRDLRASYIPTLTIDSSRSKRRASFGISTFNTRLAAYYAPLKGNISPVVAAGADLGRKASYSNAGYRPISGLGEIKASVIAGGGVRGYIDKVELLAIGYRDVTGTRAGIDAEFKAKMKIMTQDRKIVFQPNVFARFADTNFLNSQFGITAAQAASSAAGYTNTFQVDKAGFYAAGAGADVRYFIDDGMFIRLNGEFTHLLSKVTDSPIVQLYGSKNQYSIGLSLNFNLGIGQKISGKEG